MKMAGVPPTDPAMARAREWVLERGGPTQANVFTKITLALFGQYPWSGVPAMPVEIMLLPRWSYFNVWEISYWSRTVLIPLLIVMDRRPVHPVPRDAGIDELWAHHLHLDDPAYARRGLVSWKNIFIGVDGFLKTWEAFGPRPWRGRAIRAAHDWLVPRMTVPGGLGGIYPAMVNGILAMRLLGYPDDHRLIAGQIKEIEALGARGAAPLPRAAVRVARSGTPRWPSTRSWRRGCPPATRPSSAPRTGSWTARCPSRATGRSSAPGSSPAAGPSSSTTPSTRISTTPRWSPWGSTRSTTRTTAGGAPAIERAVRWLRGMQGKDGGLGARSTRTRRGSSSTTSRSPITGRSSTRPPRTSPPAASSASRGSGVPRDDPAIQRGLAFLRRTQTAEGAWHGRWGVNYLYGTWSVLRALEAIGLRADDPDGRAGDPLARGSPEPGRGLGRDLRLLRRRRTSRGAACRGPARRPGRCSA